MAVNMIAKISIYITFVIHQQRFFHIDKSVQVLCINPCEIILFFAKNTQVAAMLLIWLLPEKDRIYGF